MTIEEAKEEYLVYDCSSRVVECFSRAFTDEEIGLLKSHTHSTLISGGMIAFDRGLSAFLNLLHDKCQSLFLLSEVTAENRIYTDEKISFPHLCVPHLFAKEIVILGMDIPYSLEMENFCLRDRALNDALINLLGRYEGNMTYGYAVNFVWHAYNYWEKFLRVLKPQKVILWNQFYSFHIIAKSVCRKIGIPVYYMEFGSIPGTIALMEKGQMGESNISKRYWIYRHLPVDDEQLACSKAVIDYIRNNNIDRNPLPDNDSTDKLNHLIDHNKPTIVFLGHNDYESGTYPYGYGSYLFHSPIFKSSDEAAIYLYDLCMRNDWNFIYKPHPLVLNVGHKYDSEEYSQINIVERCNILNLIDIADVCITILSQSSYTCLIRNKPVVMLGYNQLKKKGCTYEAYNKSCIIHAINDALHDGYNERQKQNFYKHVAIMLRYCLYDDMAPRQLRYGKKL